MSTMAQLHFATVDSLSNDKPAVGSRYWNILNEVGDAN